MTHLHIGKLPIKKQHINLFCIYTGLTLMATDAVVANLLNEWLEHYEAFFSAGGKWGAALAAIPPILERTFGRTTV